MIIYIEESSWSGYIPEKSGGNYKSEVNYYKFKPEFGKEYILKKKIFGRTFSFEVVEIREKVVRIKTSLVMSEGDKGINLGAINDEFIIRFDDATILYSPTTDCGLVYKIMLKE